MICDLDVSQIFKAAPRCPSLSSTALQHGWDVNSAVEWYLESGGVGHGAAGAALALGAGAGGGPGAGGGDDWDAGGWEDVGAEAGAAPAYGGSAAAAAAPALPPDYIEEPDDVIVEDPSDEQQPAAAGGAVRSMRGRAASRPMPASARPRSSPIEVRNIRRAACTNQRMICAGILSLHYD